MDKIWAFFFVVGGTIGAFLMFAASVPYDLAVFNLASYASAIGIDNPPEFLISEYTDKIAWWLGFLLVCAAVLILSIFIYRSLFGLIPLHGAAKFAYRKLQYTTSAGFAEHPYLNNEADPIGWYITALLGSTLDESIQLFAYKPNLDTLNPISYQEYKRHKVVVSNEGVSLSEKLNDRIVYDRLHIRKSDLKKKIKFIASWEMPKGDNDDQEEQVLAPNITMDKAIDYVPMSEVARMAYEKHRTEDGYESAIAAFHEGYESDNNEVLNALALAISVASKVDLFGKHDPSTVYEKIQSNVENHFEFRDSGNALHPMGNDAPQYLDVSIKSSDLDAAINSINEYVPAAALFREKMKRIDTLYAKGVELRNRAASLRVVDAKTEREMSNIRDELTNEMDDLSPAQTINLRTINTFNPGDHPSMNLQDPKQTLIFSEFLSRVQKIISEQR